MVRIYLDVCCLSRPFDDPSQDRVRLEAEAVQAIIQQAENGGCILLGSSALEYEAGRASGFQRQARLQEVLAVFEERVQAGGREFLRAQHWQQLYRLSAMDALHLACAESLRADFFLTVDDRLLRAVNRPTNPGPPFRVMNPHTWLTESEVDE